MTKNSIVAFMNFWLSLYYPFTSWVRGIRLPVEKKNEAFDACIVSLTTSPTRIHKSWLAIESILRQKEQPDALILYLSDDEFLGERKLPKRLQQQQKRGLQVVFVKGLLRPHHKYIHAMEQYPKAKVVTIDDDKIYPNDLLKNLKKYHSMYPESICAVMTRKIRYVDEVPLPYDQWPLVKVDTAPQHDLLSLGVSGVLFPAGSLHPDVFDQAMIKKIAVSADDLWIKVMALRNNTPVVSLAGCYPKPFLSVRGLAATQLRLINISRKKNDIIFNDLIRHYQLTEASIFNK